jgi:hypothetical protein
MYTTGAAAALLLEVRGAVSREWASKESATLERTDVTRK